VRDVSETSANTSGGEFEAVLFESGWFVVREVDSRGENGQWIATRTAVPVEQ
jgi:hypothetical protein